MARRRHGDDGYALVESLLVLVLAAVALPIYLGYRDQAKERVTQADVHNAIAAVEVCYQDGDQTLPDSFAATTTNQSITCGSDPDQGQATVTVSDGDSITLTVDTSATPNTYQIVVTNEDLGETYTYTSADSSTVKS